MSDIDFSISDGPLRILAWKSGGCRPATNSECALWDRISKLERELASARSEADSLADKIEDMINEFGDDPKAALQCVSEWLDLRNHEKAIASRNRRLAEQEGT